MTISLEVWLDVKNISCRQPPIPQRRAPGGEREFSTCSCKRREVWAWKRVNNSHPWRLLSIKSWAYYPVSLPLEVISSACCLYWDQVRSNGKKRKRMNRSIDKDTQYLSSNHVPTLHGTWLVTMTWEHFFLVPILHWCMRNGTVQLRFTR